MMEFTRGQFAIEERGLVSQVEEWAALVRRDADGAILFARPEEGPQRIDSGYTGLLSGDRPVYGYAIVYAQGNYLDRSAAMAPGGRPSPPTEAPILLSGVGLDGSGPLLIAEVHVSEADVWLCVGRARSDVSVLANTFFAQVLEELGWAALLLLIVTVATAVVTVRMSLVGLRRVAAQAGAITFENFGRERLGGETAPMEVQPIISAVNAALDSIEAGARAQRDFSIHAAHELRTPLADLRLRLEGGLTEDPHDDGAQGRPDGDRDHIHLQIVAHPDADVEPLGDDVDVAVLDAQLALDLGMRRHQPREGRPDERVRGMLSTGHAQTPARSSRRRSRASISAPSSATTGESVASRRSPPAAYAAQLAAMGDRLHEPETFRRSPIAPSAQAGNCHASALISAG